MASAIRVAARTYRIDTMMPAAHGCLGKYVVWPPRVMDDARQVKSMYL